MVLVVCGLWIMDYWSHWSLVTEDDWSHRTIGHRTVYGRFVPGRFVPGRFFPYL